ncbi:DUF4062 domain-containing protein [Peribacillus huizhouensis]|uniref:DUF4062 domain-containing protein n=1 Tax=Peribacillus huizhouensis TaxID=1501239 RepID=A0ABR6CRC9_9BACI|nr:DUF4062 domain-containing protein [Peribacillus huizhouensis]MBA9027592.1 hypothetical protein [Peribacillus huizhouensis]
MQDKKFQIFISSTYKDLIEAREKVFSTILSMYHFPVGMEMFSADNDEQWKIIQDTMMDSDYYILIIGHRYGSVTKEGISYTEKEYDYAKSLGIPIMSFVRNRDVATTPNEREGNKSNEKKLDEFIKKVTEGKMCEFWETSDDLVNKITIALVKAFSRHQRTGWIRADKAITPEMSEEFLRLSKENYSLRQELDELKKKQIGKEPNLEILINESDKLKIKFQENLNFEHLGYLEQIDYSLIEEYLLPYIKKEEIENYNNNIPTNQEIDKFNQEAIYFTRLTDTGLDLSFSISNIGSAKANEIFIDITFPNEVKILKKDEIEDLELPKIPTIPENPIEVAEKEYDKANMKKILGEFKVSNIYDLIGSQALSAISSYPPLTRGYSQLVGKNILTVRNTTFLNENTITLKLSDLLHTRMYTFDDEYLLVPLKKGSFHIKVTVICEEYSEEKGLKIPLSVL